MYQECPNCTAIALPSIAPESRANAVTCQHCRAVIERPRLEKFLADKAAAEKQKKQKPATSAAQSAARQQSQKGE